MNLSNIDDVLSYIIRKREQTIITLKTTES